MNEQTQNRFKEQILKKSPVVSRSELVVRHTSLTVKVGHLIVRISSYLQARETTY